MKNENVLSIDGVDRSIIFQMTIEMPFRLEFSGDGRLQELTSNRYAKQQAWRSFSNC